MNYRAIWLYDGVCVLCSRAVQFTLQYEKSATIRFVSIQSERGRKIAIEHGLDPDNPDSFIFIDNGISYQKFDGILALARHLKAPANWIRICRFLPKFMRDWIYDRIAQNRYRWFGRLKSCYIPEPSNAHRFIS